MARNRGDGLYERKRNNSTRSSWMYDVVIDGERFVRKIHGSLTRTEARNLATTLRSDYVKGLAGIRKRRDITFDDAADLFLKHARTNRKLRTVRYHEQTIAKLREEFSGRKLSKITTFGVETYRRKRSVKAPVRVNREIAVLRLVFNKMNAWGKYEGANPAVGIRFAPEPQNTIRFLDYDEEERLLAECSEPLRTILILGIHSRPSNRS